MQGFALRYWRRPTRLILLLALIGAGQQVCGNETIIGATGEMEATESENDKLDMQGDGLKEPDEVVESTRSAEPEETPEVRSLGNDVSESQPETCRPDPSVEESMSALQNTNLKLSEKLAALQSMLDEAGEGGVRGLLDAVEKHSSSAEEGRTLFRQKSEENVLLESRLSAAQEELNSLRGQLSESELKASEAREEAVQHAKNNEEIGRRLERSESELSLAKKPRKVSLSAIAADVRELYSDVHRESSNALYDVYVAVEQKYKQVEKYVKPYLKAASDKSEPYVNMAMEKTQPYRAKATDQYEIMSAKLYESVGSPALQQWEIAKKTGIKTWQTIHAKCGEAEVAAISYLQKAGLSEETAQKICKYTTMMVLGIVTVILVIYFGGTFVTYIVAPVVRTLVRLALWMVMLPFRILMLPVRLLLWILTSFFGLFFGRGKGKSGQKPERKTPAKTSKSGKKSTLASKKTK